MARKIGTVLVNVEANTQKLVDGFNSAEKRVDSAVSTMKKSVIGLTTAYLSFEAIVGGGKMFLQQADAMTSATSRLKLVTANSQELLNVQKQLFDIAQKSRTGYLETIDLYTNISRSAKEYNIEQSKILAITDSISKATIISGASAASTEAALTQLGQAFASNFKGVGQELGSLREQAPRVYQAMVEGMGTTSDKFKKLAEDGKLSTEIIIEALLKGTKAVDSEFGTMTITIEQGFTQLSNTTLLLIRDINKVTGASDSLANTFKDISKNIDENRTQIVHYSQITSAAIGKTVDNFLLLGADIKNTAELLLDSIGIMTFGALKPIASVILDITKILHDLNLSSDSTLKSSQGLYDFAEKGLTNFKASAVNNLADIDNAYKKANVSIADRIKLQEEEWKASNTNNSITKKKNGTKITKDDSAIIKIMGTEYEKFNLELEENIKKLKEAGATQTEVDKYRADSLKEFNEKQLKDSKKTNDEIKKQAETTSKAYLEIAKIGMSEYEKALASISEKTQSWLKDGVSLNDALSAQSVLIAELNTKTQYEAQKEELGYYERKIQLMDESISKELELEGISYANRIFEIEQTTKTIAEKDKLISKETELYNATIQTMNIKNNTEFEDTMKTFYDDMLDSQLALNAAVYDFGSGFSDAATKIGAVSKSLAAMSSLDLTNKKEASSLDKKYIEQFNKYAGDVEKTKELEQQYAKDTTLLNDKNIQAQIEGYANIAGAMANSFDEGSKAAEIFTRVQATAAIIAGTTAVLKAAEAPPPIGFASMVGMAATVTSILANAGIAFGGIGGSKTTTTSDSFSAQEANTGIGSTLGDATAQSESMSKALGILEDFALPQFETLQSMNKYLENISNSIGGVTSLLIQQGGFSFGAGAKEYDTGFSNNISTPSGLGTIGAGIGYASQGATAAFGIGVGGAALVGTGIGLAAIAIDKLLLGGAVTGLIDNVLGSVIGGLFGKTSVSQSLKDSGIYFADTLLTSAIDEFDGEAYQTIATTTKKKSWFSSSSSTSINSYFEDLDNETERQFSLVLDNLYTTVLLSGQALDKSAIDTASSLSNFIVSIGKISLKDKTGAEIQEVLTSVFGKISDDITKAAFPLLTPFQQVGEGLFETLTRVATGMEAAEYYISRLGNRFEDVIYTAIGDKQGDVGFEALLQSIQKIENATYPANNGLLNIIENLDATAEELYAAYTSLDELRDRLIFLKQEAIGLSNAMIYGAGSMTSLDEGFKSYFENFLSENEQLTYETQQLIEEFNNLGIALPASKDAFKDLLSSLDLTTESGQELYGRLIILSESFASVADETAQSIEALTVSLSELSGNEFDNFISALNNIGDTITSIKNTALNFIKSLSNSSDASLEDKLISYNKMRKQFATYFDEKGNIKAGVDKEEATELYSQISSLAQSIISKDDAFKDGIASQFQDDIANLNLNATEVDKVLQVALSGEQGEALTSLKINGVTLDVNQSAAEQLSTLAKGYNWNLGDEAIDFLDSKYGWSNGLNDSVLTSLSSKFDWSQDDATIAKKLNSQYGWTPSASDINYLQSIYGWTPNSHSIGYLSSKYNWSSGLSSGIETYLSDSNFDWAQDDETIATKLKSKFGWTPSGTDISYLKSAYNWTPKTTDISYLSSKYNWSSGLTASIQSYLGEEFDWTNPDDALATQLKSKFGWTPTTADINYLKSSYNWTPKGSELTYLQSKYGWGDSLTSGIQTYLSESFDWTQPNDTIATQLKSKFGWTPSSSEISYLKSAYAWTPKDADISYLSSKYSWSGALTNSVKTYLGEGFDWSAPNDAIATQLKSTFNWTPTDDEIDYLKSAYNWTPSTTDIGYLASKYGWANQLSTDLKTYLSSSSFDWAQDDETIAKKLKSKFGWTPTGTDIDFLQSAYGWTPLTKDISYLSSKYNWSSGLTDSIQTYLGEGFDWTAPDDTISAQLNSKFGWQPSNADLSYLRSSYAWTPKEADISYLNSKYGWGNGLTESIKTYLGEGFDWTQPNATIATQLKSKFGWTPDDDDITYLKSAYSWTAVGSGFAPALKILGKDFNWAYDELAAAVNGVSTMVVGGKKVLAFDWNNDDVVDATAIIGEDGTLTDIKKGVYTSDAITSVGAMSALAMAMTNYNDNIARLMEKDLAGISSNTFKFGDYTGTQEKIDISRATGLSGDSLANFVSKIQDLDSLTGVNMHVAMNNMLGYNGLQYDQNQAADIKAIQPYLRTDISSYFNAIQADAITNNAAKQKAEAAAAAAAAKQAAFEQAKAAFNASYSNTIAQLNKWKETMATGVAGNYNLRQGPTSYVLGKTSAEIEALMAKGYGAKYSTDETYLSWQKNIEKYQAIYNSQTAQKTLKGYAVGTTYIEHDQTARVHQGEIITPRNFSDGIRAGELSLGNNNEIVAAINTQTGIIVAQAREIQKMKENIEEMNSRELIKNIKGAI